MFRKYSYSLSPDVIDFLEVVLEKHEIPDEETEHSINALAKEYNKQDGTLLIYYLVQQNRRC